MLLFFKKRWFEAGAILAHFLKIKETSESLEAKYKDVMGGSRLLHCAA